MRYFAIIILFFFISCSDDRGVYEKIYSNEYKNITLKTISIKGDNYYLLDKVKRAFKKMGIKIKKDEPILIVMSSHYVINCENPVVHAVGADYNGYIRLSLRKNNKELYRIQKDFRSKVTQDMIDKIINKLLSKQ